MAEQPRPSRVEKVLVIGAGVSGLTTALELARVRENDKPRYTVQVVAERPADQTVSVIAGALWEFPPAVCGQHGNQLSIMRSKRWSVESYKEFQKLAQVRGNGVHMAPTNFYFGVKIEDDWLEHTKMRELKKLSEDEEIQGFRRMTEEDLKKVRPPSGSRTATSSRSRPSTPPSTPAGCASSSSSRATSPSPTASGSPTAWPRRARRSAPTGAWTPSSTAPAWAPRNWPAPPWSPCAAPWSGYP
ncbi:hypothetical protein SBADM41S_06863 [Streptomyces badius]